MNLLRLGILSLSLGLFITAALPQAEVMDSGTSAPAKTAAVIIDDFGNKMKGTQEMMKLPFKITVAVMPFLPTTKADAEAAHQAGHDVIVHLPMEPLTGRASWLGPGAIMVDLEDDEIRRRVHAALDDVPYAVGINNHMGSKVTSNEHVMRLVLEVCRERRVFFLDSHTNYRSVAGKIASELGVPSLDNHLFLDDVRTSSHIKKQLGLLCKHSQEQEYGIAIGHVGSGGPMVAKALRDWAAELPDNIRLVGISTLFAEKFPFLSTFP